MRWMFAWLMTGCLTCVVAGPVCAQFVAGDWVERGEVNIREHRMTPVSFLVLDAQGKLVPNAEVRVEQLSHAFTVGFVMGETFPEAFDSRAEGWRVFNAVSLERLTSWRQMQPGGPGEFLREAVDAAVASAEAAGLGVRWGALVSAEAFDLPEWVVPLRGEALWAAIWSYAQRVAWGYADRVDELDLAEKTLGQDRLSPATLRLLAMELRAIWPTATPALRYDDVLSGSRVFEVISDIDGVLKQRLAIDAFTIDLALPPRPVAQDRLEPALQRLAKLERPLTVGSLEVSAAHGIEAAVNTETVLRTLFAEPIIEGLYFSGLYAADTFEPSAALFDDDGQATAIARTADRLFREVWWSDTTVETNALGQAKTRVFLGDYRVTATLPDGTAVSVPLRLENREETPAEIILMPVTD